ncbi:sigma-70 family RNA polymerase sigma factor [Sphingomonas fuzhouensis]|uniref:sigma-70 family RNA polymerase sigma factor n=1 Tax=Sphingomonas fuzhouensis TaxID=3106033 RepID=UPI002B002A6A|nr:sigma-70 family RNA polymerase sigma factor [Sphingomonas sp. SGZ-02]
MTTLPSLTALFADQRRRLVTEAARFTGDTDSAEDVVQDAWLRLAQRGAEPSLVEPIGYIRRVVRNLALDAYRQRRRREAIMPHGSDTESEKIEAGVADAEQTVIAAQHLALVAAELTRMPQRMRRAVELHRLSGAPLREIAAELGVSVTTAHTLVMEGVERCRRALHPSPYQTDDTEKTSRLRV